MKSWSTNRPQSSHYEPYSLPSGSARPQRSIKTRTHTGLTGHPVRERRCTLSQNDPWHRKIQQMVGPILMVYNVYMHFMFTLWCTMVHNLCIYSYVYRHIKAAATNPLNVHHPSQIKKCSREGSTSKAWNKAQCFDPFWVPSYDQINWENPNPKVSSPKLLSFRFAGKKAPSFKVIVALPFDYRSVHSRREKNPTTHVGRAKSTMFFHVRFSYWMAIGMRFILADLTGDAYPLACVYVNTTL